jgi:hypothetical protein
MKKVSELMTLSDQQLIANIVENFQITKDCLKKILAALTQAILKYDSRYTRYFWSGRANSQEVLDLKKILTAQLELAEINNLEIFNVISGFVNNGTSRADSLNVLFLSAFFESDVDDGVYNLFVEKIVSNYAGFLLQLAELPVAKMPSNAGALLAEQVGCAQAARSSSAESESFKILTALNSSPQPLANNQDEPKFTLLEILKEPVFVSNNQESALTSYPELDVNICATDYPLVSKYSADSLPVLQTNLSKKTSSLAGSLPKANKNLLTMFTNFVVSSAGNSIDDNTYFEHNQSDYRQNYQRASSHTID